MNELLQDSRVRKILKAVFFAVIIFSVFLVVISLNALKEFNFIGSGINPVNTITVSGEGEVFAIPDVGQFTFTVNTEAKTVKEAQDMVSEKISSAIKALKDKGVEEKDIKTVSYNAYPRYEYRKVDASISLPSGSSRVLAGYNVSQTIDVKIKDTEKAGEIVGIVGELGITDVSGLSFMVDDEDEFANEAREKAIEDAKTKARQLAKDLGVRLNKIVSFSENVGPYAYARMEKFGLGGDMVSNAMPTVEVPTGETKIISQVMITYEIR